MRTNTSEISSDDVIEMHDIIMSLVEATNYKDDRSCNLHIVSILLEVAAYRTSRDGSIPMVGSIIRSSLDKRCNLCGLDPAVLNSISVDLAVNLVREIPTY